MLTSPALALVVKVECVAGLLLFVPGRTIGRALILQAVRSRLAGSPRTASCAAGGLGGYPYDAGCRGEKRRYQLCLCTGYYVVSFSPLLGCIVQVVGLNNTAVVVIVPLIGKERLLVLFISTQGACENVLLGAGEANTGRASLCPLCALCQPLTVSQVLCLLV